jgi:hypothetical protein
MGTGNGWGDIFDLPEEEGPTAKTLRDVAVLIGGKWYQLAMGSARDPMGGPGATRQLVFEPIGGDRTTRAAASIPFAGAGQYVTADGKMATVDASGNIIGAKSIPQDQWETLMNDRLWWRSCWCPAPRW